MDENMWIIKHASIKAWIDTAEHGSEKYTRKRI
jgi:hypothetical protein